MAPRAWCAVVLSLAGLSGAPAARADRPHARPIQLIYVRGPGASSCPEASALRAGVEEELGYDPFDETAARKLKVSIERRRGELAVEMEYRNEAGELIWEERSIRTRGDCRTLVGALGLSITIRIEPSPLPPPCPTCPACPPPVVPSPRPAPVPPSPPPAADAVEAPPAGPVPMVGGGPLSGVTSPLAIVPGVELFGGVRWPGVSLAVEARAVLPGTRDNQVQHVTTSSLVAVLAPCAHLGWFAGCGLFEGGALHVGGPDAVAAFETLGILGAGLRAGAEWRLSRRLIVRAHLDALGTFVHQDIVILKKVWNAPVADGFVGIDLAVLFPASPFHASGVPSTSSTKGSAK